MTTTWINKQQMRQSFNAAATTYNKAADFQREVADLLLNKMTAADLTNAKILDIGSGTGYLTKRLHSLPIISLDIAEQMLRLSKQNFPQQKYICNDIESLCIIDNSIDLIISSLALHWCQDIQTAFQEIHRILKPGGKICFTLLGQQSLHELQQAWRVVDNKPHVNRFINNESLQENLKSLFSTTSFETKIITWYHDSTLSLMKELKAIGAHNVATQRSKSLTGKQKLTRLQAAHEPFRAENNLLPATYEVIIGNCIK